MEANSTHARTSAAAGTKLAAETAELRPEQAVSQNISGRTTQATISVALSAARAETSAILAAGVRFPGEDGGHSLAEMAQRDLDAALQLLADRAQYITGASGAAIAIRRDGKNDMLCRASAGMNAPELGALLSAEFGLSGESVRTRQPLRCDDAERDKRVNREVCREMGIASVVVMPVVHDDEVLGVFELFSGKANAFGARDVSAVRRLSEMVETAVRLARATENLPERLKLSAIAGPAVKEIEATAVEEADVEEVEVLEEQVLEGEVFADVILQDPISQDPVLNKGVLRKPGPVEERLPGSAGAEAPTQTVGSIAALEALRRPKTAPLAAPETAPLASPLAASETSPAPAPEAAAPKKKLFWSAALDAAAESGKAEEPDQSRVPPVLRSLRKCTACGFPVSAGRTLCVECEEKKWRGQLKPGPRPVAIPSAAAVAAVAKPVARPDGRAFAAAQSSAARSSSAAQGASSTVAASGRVVPALPALQGERAKESSDKAIATAAASSMKTIERESTIEPAAPILSIPTSVASSVPSSDRLPVASPGFVLSAGLEPSQPWLAANKYIVGVLLMVAAAVAAVFLLR
jgi:GAF domain-containing protein